MSVKRVSIVGADAEVLRSNLIVFNKKDIGESIDSGAKIYTDEGQRFEQYTRHPRGYVLSIGAFSYVVDATSQLLSVNIGRYCSIARGTNIVQGNHPIDSVTTNPYHYGSYAKKNLPDALKYAGPVGTFPRSFGRTKIGNDVWIGGHCTIKGGITIGDGAVVASGSVVVKDVAPYTIVGGTPRPLSDLDSLQRSQTGCASLHGGIGARCRSVISICLTLNCLSTRWNDDCHANSLFLSSRKRSHLEGGGLSNYEMLCWNPYNLNRGGR